MLQLSAKRRPLPKQFQPATLLAPLDLLQSKQLPDGSFPLEKRHWKESKSIVTNGAFFDFGPHGKRRGNPFVTLEAFEILKSAGRL